MLINILLLHGSIDVANDRAIQIMCLSVWGSVAVVLKEDRAAIWFAGINALSLYRTRARQ